jgi:hypothetical protein
MLADDTVRCHVLDGLSRRKVVALIGTPTDHEKRTVYYAIGPERDSLFVIDDEVLIIHFDRHNLFTKAEFAQT